MMLRAVRAAKTKRHNPVKSATESKRSFTPRHRLASLSLAWITLFTLTSIYACNDRRVALLDQSLESSSVQEITVDAKTKIDILFVIDESQSMIEEQESLAANFDNFSNFIFEDLKNTADYRIAIVSTGTRLDGSAIYSENLGEFVYQSKANDSAQRGCPETLNPIISPQSVVNGGMCPESDFACQQEQLRFQFSCLAKVGTNGVNAERGLEAMRSSLSCNGPNGDLFGKCCQVNTRTSRLDFDPICRGSGEDPQFLRPDALLMVVFITDEDDCSTYADAGIDSPFATCQADPAQINDILRAGTAEARAEANRVIFAGYSDVSLCGSDPTACYSAECTTGNGELLDNVDCYYERCEIRLPADEQSPAYGNACRWQGYKLAPVEYYFNFLNRLKVRPAEQILVANIVAPGLLTSTSQRLTFAEGDPAVAGCEIGEARDLNMCCPSGFCGGIYDFNTCEVFNQANNITCAEGDLSCQGSSGYSSWRYIDLMSMFGDNGLGCREGQGGGCVNICNPDLSEALNELRTKVLNTVGDYCVARRPACLVTDPMTGETRECVEQEALQPAYYQLRVKRTCEISELEGGACGPVGVSRYLGETEYTLDINDATCTSGVRVQLTTPPPAGSTTELELLQSLVVFDE